MARSKARRMKPKKYEWMQTRLSYQVDVSASSDPHADSIYLDTARGLSLMNRKLIRQGQLFRIKGMTVHTNHNTESLRVKVGTVPTNWVARNAWVKGKALWDKMNAIALAEGDSGMLPKYHDYKVYMNDGHKAQSSEFVPCDMDGETLATTNSEWAYSKYADSGSTADNYDVKFLGQHEGSTSDYTTVGLIEAYRQSRVRPQTTDPEWPSDTLTSPWMLLFGDDDQTSDVLTNLRDDNDAAPYPPDFYVGDAGGGTNHQDDGGFGVGTFAVNKVGSGGKITFPSFVAPCGLMRIEIDDDDSLTAQIHITFDVEILGPMDM